MLIFLMDGNIENIAAHFAMGYAPILFRYYNLGIGLCQLKGARRGVLGYSGASEIARCEGDMLDTDGRAGWRRPLEQGLDLSAMAVPLYWAEGGQVVRVCGSRISLEDVITWYRMGCTAEMICEDYPWLELGDIYTVIAYYLRNKERVHAYFLASYERTEELWDSMRAEGMISDESWQAWCEERHDRLQWAKG